MPFPYDRYDGKGYDRVEVVDIEAMKRHYESSPNGKVEQEEPAVTPADD